MGSHSMDITRPPQPKQLPKIERDELGIPVDPMISVQPEYKSTSTKRDRKLKKLKRQHKRQGRK